MESVPLRRLEIAPLAPEYWRDEVPTCLQSVELHTGRFRVNEAELVNLAVGRIRRCWPEFFPWLVLEWRDCAPGSEQSEALRSRIGGARFKRELQEQARLLQAPVAALQWSGDRAPPIGMAMLPLPRLSEDVFTRLQWPAAFVLLRGRDPSDVLSTLVPTAGEAGGSRLVSGVLRLIAEDGILIAFSEDRDLVVCDVISKNPEPIAELFRPWVDPTAKGLIG